jgi:hypothetical protein
MGLIKLVFVHGEPFQHSLMFANKTIASYKLLLITTVKNFITMNPGANVKKLFTDLIYELAR